MSQRITGKRRPQTGIIDEFNGNKENDASFVYKDTFTIILSSNMNLENKNTIYILAFSVSTLLAA